LLHDIIFAVFGSFVKQREKVLAVEAEAH
jgi:hypothetical protein